MFQTEVVEKIKTSILFSVTFFRKSCRLCDNVEKYFRAGRPQMAIWHMRIACWMPKATNTHTHTHTHTHTGCVILIAFPLQQWLHEHASMLRVTYIACLVCIAD